jgi:hypothetical protein
MWLPTPCQEGKQRFKYMFITDVVIKVKFKNDQVSTVAVTGYMFCPGLILHRNKYGWSLTHQQSGRSVLVSATWEEVMGVRELAYVCDWTLPFDHLRPKADMIRDFLWENNFLFGKTGVF